MASYELNTFLPTPNDTDTRLKIYDKYLNLRYTIDPSLSYFYANANIAVISVEGDNNINLDFLTSSECNEALSKLNNYKQIILSNITTSPTTILGLTSDIFSTSNLNMVANVTNNINTLACDTVIIDVPLIHSYVRVFINGVEVNSGGNVYPFDCYFSGDDGLSVRLRGDERTGDKLYWNGSVAGYELDSTDLIDFVYLTKINI